LFLYFPVSYFFIVAEANIKNYPRVIRDHEIFITFFRNYAVDREGRSTIVAGTPGQQYVDNVFFNPDNDYEMLTTNRSR